MGIDQIGKKFVKSASVKKSSYLGHFIQGLRTPGSHSCGQFCFNKTYFSYKIHYGKFSCSFSINLYQICVFCLFTRVYLQYYCICLQQYWRLVLQLIFNNFAIWCKIFAIENLFFHSITKKLQSSTTPILDFKQQLPILAGHGTRTHDPWVASPVPYPFLHEISYWKTWKFTYINTYQTFAIWYKIFATWYKIFAIENLFLNSDTKYLQLKIYFSIQIQKNCKHVVGM